MRRYSTTTNEKGYKMKAYNLLSKEAMEKLPTKRLLAYKSKLLKVRGLSNCRCGDSGCSYLNDRNTDPNEELLKVHAEWQEAYANIKHILDKREHIERKVK